MEKKNKVTSLPKEGAVQKEASVKGEVNYMGKMAIRPRYHANDSTRDVLNLDPRTMDIVNGRLLQDPPKIEREGFALVAHETKIDDFSDVVKIGEAYRSEIQELIKNVFKADEVVINAPGILRFGEKSKQAGTLNNSKAARFIHVDISRETAHNMAKSSPPPGGKVRRFAHINIWRALTQPDQDVPLTLCDVRSVNEEDFIPADAVFDEKGKDDWSFEGLVVAHNPSHRWLYFPQMTRNEALVFTIYDSDETRPSQVPHSAFTDYTCPSDSEPRCSIEMRAVAYWYE